MKRERLTSPFDPDYEAKTKKGRLLNRSSRLDYHLCSDADEVEALVEELHKLFVEHTKPKNVQWKTDLPNLKVLVLNLFKAHLHRAGWYVAYSRTKSGYLARGRYNHLCVSFTIVKLIDALTELGLLEGRKGHYFPQSKKESRVRATPQLIAKFDEEYCLDDAMIYRLQERETIILKTPKDKSGKAKLAPYEDDDETRRMRGNVGKINTLLRESDFTLSLTPEGLEQLKRAILKAIEEGDERKRPLDFSRGDLHRTFNDSRWDHGGRFYGGWWQSVPSDYREFILINGLPTCEVDYSSLHPRILYAKEGLTPPDDCYEIEGVGREHRKLIKAAFLRIINADGYDAAKMSLYADCADLVRRFEGGVDPLLERIGQSHKAIRHKFYSGEGVKLQYEDSRIAEKVMLHFVEKGIPILPVHDSFITYCFFEEELKEVMESEIEKSLKVIGVTDSKFRPLRFVDLSYLRVGNG